MNPLMFPIQDELRAALDKEATKRDVSRSKLIRDAICAYIGFDASKLPVAASRQKYATPELRKAAQKERNKVKNDRVKELIRMAEAGASDADMRALAASIAGKVD